MLLGAAIFVGGFVGGIFTAFAILYYLAEPAPAYPASLELPPEAHDLPGVRRKPFLISSFRKTGTSE